MEELSIEEKAKRYDEALAWMVELYPTMEGAMKEDAEHYFHELKESEGEKMLRILKEGFTILDKDEEWYDGVTVGQILAWFEKQGEHANFCNKIQIGDKVTRNRDGVLVNLSQLNRVAKKDEKQGEQKPAWSEEDEKMIRGLIAICDEWSVRYSYYPVENCDMEKLKNWLKSLKERYTWKPSDEQMKQLGWVAEQNEDNVLGKELMSLYQDLKKLREE